MLCVRVYFIHRDVFLLGLGSEFLIIYSVHSILVACIVVNLAFNMLVQLGRRDGFIRKC